MVDINSNRVDSFVCLLCFECKSPLVRANGGGTGGTSVCVVPCGFEPVCVCVYEEVTGRGLGSLMMRIKGLLNCERGEAS